MSSPRVAESRMLIAVTIALAAHALLLFAIRLPDPADIVRRVPVTLSVDPGPRREPTAVGAATNQVGPDAESRRSRAAATTAGAADTAPAQDPPGDAGDSSSALLATPSEPAPATAAGAIQRGGSPIGQPDSGAAPEARTRTANADMRAAYLADWKRRVELVGGEDFPFAALRGDQGSKLTLEVTLNAAGGLAATRIVQSSGNAELDRAALRILQASGPFAPFPPALREASPRLTFAYVWRFLPSRGGELSVQ